MAERPVFIPVTTGSRLVNEVSIEFPWHKGMAPSQKMKNVTELHKAAAKRGYERLLEISTKSEEKLGWKLSAFNLKVPLKDGTKVPLECVFQGSKVFENGGPHVELYKADSRDAKRDDRLKNSGELIAFQFEDIDFPVFPKTAFYDWLYIRSLVEHKEYLKRLEWYDGFTDIEFNPKRSISCQARSCATFVALIVKGQLEEAMASTQSFLSVLSPDSVWQPHSIKERQGDLF